MNLKCQSSKFKISKFKLINDKFDNNISINFPKKINKISKFVHTSESSTLNTNTNSQIEDYLNENNQTNLNENININNPEIITNKFKIAFNALEQLIIDDENNDNNKNEEISNKNDLDIKNSSNIPIPKLDFSDIFDNYNNSPVYIREIINKKYKKNCFTNYIKEKQN